MNIFFSVAALLMAAAAAEPKAPPAPRREKVTCAQYRARLDESSKRASFDTRLKAGSWGAIPPVLRKLPPRAKLCGADTRGQAVIASPLFGDELQGHYAPLFAKLGFGAVGCEVSGGQTRCTSKRHRDIGILVTDATSEVYVLSFLLRSPQAPRAGASHGR